MTSLRSHRWEKEVEGIGWSAPRSRRFTFRENLDGPKRQAGEKRNISLTGIQSQDRLACNQSLHTLRYSAQAIYR